MVKLFETNRKHLIPNVENPEMFPLRQYRQGFGKQKLKDNIIRQEFDGVNFAYNDVKLSKKKNTNNKL